ncbi:MAG: cache domain-containing protein, partial [Giesbergeria sp.]
MTTFKQLSVARRLTGLVGFALLAMLVLAGVLMVSERSLIRQERESSVRQAVETAYGVIAHFHEQASKGAMTEDEAKQRAKETVRSLRYSDTEYFWINDMHPTMVMHPISTKLEGQDLSGNKDPTGKFLFVEFVNTVKK